MGGSFQRPPKKNNGRSPEARTLEHVCYVVLVIDVCITALWLVRDMISGSLVVTSNTFLAYGKCGLIFGLTLILLWRLRCSGLPLSLNFKICGQVIAAGWVIFNAVTSRPNETWHMLLILSLDVTQTMKSDDDALIMDRLASVILLVFAVYSVFHNLSVSGLGPNIHFVHHEKEIDFFTKLFLDLVPLFLNFQVVRSFGRNLRYEVKCTRISVEAASNVGRALVDFDLDKAYDMMACMEEDSPIFEPLMKLIHNLRTYRPFLPSYLFPQSLDNDCEPTNRVTTEVMSGKSTSWNHAKTAAQRLRDPDYSLNDFRADVEAAFPELELYNIGPDGNVHKDGSLCSSGRTGLEEYQRTLGAFYSVYSIARLDIDGKEIFSFGVDLNGKPVAVTDADIMAEKKDLYLSMDWTRMLELFIRAGILKVASNQLAQADKGRAANQSKSSLPGLTGSWRRNDVPSVPVVPVSTPTFGNHSAWEESSKSEFASTLRRLSQGPDGTSSEDWTFQLEVDIERMTAFLVLTAIHDIMKNPCLMMTVHEKHAPYQGQVAGSKLLDHDLALMYTMEHFSGLLPSFHGLGPGQRAAVFFSQGKMGFNNGWLVQGEAPPGALFSRFKEVITSGGASDSDISFYFAHWLTDVAGSPSADGRGLAPRSSR